MKKVLFIDRDGTIIKETIDEQIDAFEKMSVNEALEAAKQILEVHGFLMTETGESLIIYQNASFLKNRHPKGKTSYSTLVFSLKGLLRAVQRLLTKAF